MEILGTLDSESALMKVREAIKIVESDGWRIGRLGAAIGITTIRRNRVSLRSRVILPKILTPAPGHLY